MKLKLMIVGMLFTSALATANTVTEEIQSADDEGDLNPQPLPPISEEE